MGRCNKSFHLAVAAQLAFSDWLQKFNIGFKLMNPFSMALNWLIKHLIVYNIKNVLCDCLFNYLFILVHNLPQCGRYIGQTINIDFVIFYFCWFNWIEKFGINLFFLVRFMVDRHNFNCQFLNKRDWVDCWHHKIQSCFHILAKFEFYTLEKFVAWYPSDVFINTFWINILCLYI